MTTSRFIVPTLCLVLFTGCSSTPRRADLTATPEFAKARGALLAGDHDSARGHLEAVLDMGTCPEADYYLALVDHGRGPSAYESALQHVTRSLKHKPSARAFLLKGVLLESDDPDGAARCYRMGLDRATPGSPSELMLHRNLGMLLLKQNDYERALAHLENYTTRTLARGAAVPDADLAAWGLALYRSGQDHRAAEAWRSMTDESTQREVMRAAGISASGQSASR